MGKVVAQAIMSLDGYWTSPSPLSDPRMTHPQVHGNI